MEQNRQPRIDPNLIWREVDENTVVVSPQSGKMQVLNGVGTTIWRLLVDATPREQIIEQLIVQYDVSDEQAAKDLQTFVADLDKRNLLMWGEISQNKL